MASQLEAQFAEQVKSILQTARNAELLSALHHLFASSPFQNFPVETRVHLLTTAAMDVLQRNAQAATAIITKALDLYPVERFANALAVKVLHTAGVIAGRSGNFGEAFRHLAKGIRYAAQLEDPTLLITLAIALSAVYLNTNHLEKVHQILDFAEQALHIYQSQLEPSTVQHYQIQIASNRATAYGQQERFKDAIRTLLPVVTEEEAHFAKTRSLILMNLGILLEKIGAADEAFHSYQKAWELFQSLEHPDTGREIQLLINLAALSLRTHNFANAERFARLAYERLPLVKHHPQYAAEILENLAAALAAQQKQEALRQTLPLLENYRLRLSSLDNRLSLTLQLAHGWFTLGNLDAAQQYAEEAYQLAQHHHLHQYLITSLLTLAKIAQQRKEWEQAERWLQQAAEHLDESAAAEIQIELAQRYAAYYQQVGKWEQAFHWMERAYQLQIHQLQIHWQKRMEAATLRAELDTVQQQNRQLTKLNQKLQELMQTREMTLRMLSHDLKNPLSQIQIALKLLDTSQPLSTTHNQDLLKIARNSTNTALRLIQESLMLLRLQSGSLQPKLIYCDSKRIFENSIAEVELQARHKHQTITVQFESHRLHTDPRWLHHILVNLLSNAIKYTPNGGTITARIVGKDTRVGFQVQDTGIGIEPDEMETIFLPFAKKPTAGEHSTGLGLAIAKQLTELLGGQITVESTPGEGSTFTVWIPKNSAAKNARHSSATVPTPSTKRYSASSR